MGGQVRHIASLRARGQNVHARLEIQPALPDDIAPAACPVEGTRSASGQAGDHVLRALLAPVEASSRCSSLPGPTSRTSSQVEMHLRFGLCPGKE